MYNQEAIDRLEHFISSCGGVYRAALKLRVQAATLEKVLKGRKISPATREKLEGRLGPIPLRPPPAYQASVIHPSKSMNPEFLGRLQAFVNECHLVDEASARLGVRRSTIEKILAGRSVSFVVQQRLQHLLGEATQSKGPSAPHPSMVERLTHVYTLYRERGTLEAVGREVEISRERVRQLLVKGSSLGLFDYKPHEHPYIPKEKLLADYANSQSLSRVAQVNPIPVTYLKKLLTAYGITEDDLESHRTEARRAETLAQYSRVVSSLGHHPTTTEVQRTPRWRYLHTRIRRIWGSIDAFREDLSIPRPPQGSPSFNEDMKPWREHKRRIALIARMQHLDLIRECLRESGPLRAAEIGYECGLKMSRIPKLLGLLMATSTKR